MNYICSSCESTYDVSHRLFRCTCGGYLTLPVSEPFPEKLHNRERSIWRYREAYTLPERTKAVSMGEGITPIVRRVIDGDSVLLKNDYLQPSGSFKDRGASVLVSQVRSLGGVTEVVEDSSGNAGSAIAAYSAAAGISCTVFTPEYTPDGKLTQMRCYGANVTKVRGNREQSNLAAIRAAESTMYASHLWNPYFVAGLQSVAFEIWEELGDSLPQAILVPVGGGGLLEGTYRGFEALVAWGYCSRIPRLIGVQARPCSPIHAAWSSGLDDISRYEPSKTIAEGIAVSNPPRGRAVLEAVKKSDGRVLAVSDDDILAATRVLFSMGVFVEPTSASVLAAWRELDRPLREGALLVLTGSGLKETSKLAKLLENGFGLGERRTAASG